MNLKVLVGSGDKIGLATLPFLVIGLGLNVLYPSVFAVGGPSAWLRVVSLVMLFVGGVIWGWSVGLILTQVPKGKLITWGPYTLVKHPLYTAVPLLVLPAIGFLLNSWLGVVIGLVMYAAARKFVTEEEYSLSQTFGPEWDEYSRRVIIPWL